MVDSPRNPSVQVNDDFAAAARRLEGGPLIPRVMEPLVASWTEDTVTLRQGGHEATATWIFPADFLVEGSYTEWGTDTDLWGQVHLLHTDEDIRVFEPDAVGTHRCPQCWKFAPWSIEWVAGAIGSTGTLECLSCGYRERGAQAAAAAVSQIKDEKINGLLVSITGEHTARCPRTVRA